MSTPDSDKIEIVVGNFKVDAMLVKVDGTRTLRMRRGQTFGTAVRHVRNVMPGITVEAAEQMVRDCNEFKDLDDLLGLNTPAPPSVERPPAEPTEQVDKEGPRRKRRRQAALVAALLPALAASWALGRYTDVAEPAAGETSTAAPDVTMDTAGSGQPGPAAPFDDSQFQFFAGSSSIECQPMSALEAECTDADGMVMSTKAATGPDSTIFTFSYGSERIGLRIFYDAGYADTWSRQDGSRELYPHMEVHSRYVLWGTDPKRIAEYAELLVEADRAAGPAPLAGGTTPLPPRLAALTLGTLGLDRNDVDSIIARPAVAATDAPAMVAARLVLGLDTTPAPGQSGEGEDIVALAAGIEPNPPVSTAPKPVTVPVTQPSTGTGTVTTPTAPAESTPTAPAAPVVTPETPPKTPTEPVTATPSPSKPVPNPAPTQPETPDQDQPVDPAPTQPVTPAPPVKETPNPAEPPAPETPAPPVEEAPSVPPSPGPPAEGTLPPPAEGTPGPPAGVPGPDKAPAAEENGPVDDLLILNSAWTVSA